MTKRIVEFLTLTSTVAAMLACTSCSSTPEEEGRGSTGMTQAEVTANEEGKKMVETYQTTATVTAIDPATRRITLTEPNGKQTTIKAGPEVRNFDQIRVGDQVKTTLTESVAIFVRPQEAPASTSQGSTTTVAPRGAKPGMETTDTAEVTARIIALDSQRRTVTLQYPDGTTKSVKVGEHVDLTRVRVGDDVVLQMTESLAIRVEEP